MPSRSRSRQGPTKTLTHVVSGTYPGVAVTHTGAIGDSTTETMDDFVVPSFGLRLKNGEVLNNPCNYVKDRVYGTGATSWSEIHLSSGRTILGSGCSVAAGYIRTYPTYAIQEPSARSIPPAIVHKAQLQALSSIDKTPYSFAEDVAEFHETLKFLRNPFQAMRDLSKLFQRDISKKKQTLARAKLIANAWAEYRFAFSPLLRSVVDLIDSMQTNTVRPKRRSSRGFSEFKETVSQDTTVQTNFFWTGKSSIDSKIHAAILYEVTNPVTDWKFKYGLRAKDIPVTLWAVLPYSFMVDRLVDISSSFKAITNFLDPEVKILAGSVTYRSSYLRERTLNRSTSPAGWTYNHPSSSVRRETFQYKREVWSPTALDLYPSLDIGGLVDGSIKIADLAALVTQRLK